MTSVYKEILVTETGGIARNAEFVRIGVPCARGDFDGSDTFQMLSPTGDILPVQTSILKTWHDGSIKWLLVDFAATAPANNRVIYRLVKQVSAAPTVAEPVVISREQEHWRVATGVASFLVDGAQCKPFRSIVIKGQELLSADASSSFLILADGRKPVPLVESVTVEAEGPLRAILRLEGRFDSEPMTAPRFICRMHFFADSSQVRLEFALHNPKAAKHPGGLWDLGDSGSLLFKELSLQVGLQNAGQNSIVVVPEKDGDTFRFLPSEKEIRIYQESSGGDNWDSPVHRTRDGSVRLRFNGYEISDGGKILADGKRATPVVWCGEGEVGVAATMPHFWQEFPKAVSANAIGLKLEIFPASTAELHELQGGEQKTTILYLNFATSPDELAWARSFLVVAPSPETCRSSGVFNDLPPTSEEPTPDLVDQFTSTEALLSKREVVDEYGWRNFGDLYADHEAVYHIGNVSFVSHYNNQYDGIAGLYRKALASGNQVWISLAADLARHVCDIDIYHTDNDREEYNHGLFWHTDHYVDAGLSTHRSFSREHLDHKPAHFCGGGPGAEHCYTSGLLLHYFQTGNPDYKQAVIRLAEWELLALKGPQTVLAAIKRGFDWVSLWRNSRGQRQLFPRYPLTRGTGNAITACLDAYEASGNRQFLQTTSELIRNTLHPGDDLVCRNLLDAEITWSYTVLLNAVAKFMDKKQELAVLDHDFNYARACLLAYAEWMVQHEYPYLDKPEILEYPNETWVAQDLRKSVVLYHAARYAETESQRQKFIERAGYFSTYAEQELPKHATSSLTRPVVLMLQNGWIGSRLQYQLQSPLLGPCLPVSGKATPYLNLGTVLQRIVANLLQVLPQTNSKREIAWLRARM